MRAAAAGDRIGAHGHAGDEHHIVLRGRFRLRQGDHVIDVGPGDYLRWDGAIPHDGEVLAGDAAHGGAAMFIIRIHPDDRPAIRPRARSSRRMTLPVAVSGSSAR